MSTRRPLVVAVLAALLAGLTAAAQPPKKEKEKADPKAAPKAPPRADDPALAKVETEEKSFTSADGVKAQGRWYKSAKGAASPVVLLLPEYGADPNATAWDDIARVLASKGFHAFRFAYRGHGDLKALHALDIDAGTFWTNPINAALVKGAEKAANKTMISTRDFRPGYSPMVVQDIAAARNMLDQMNDTGEVNTGNVYLVGAGDAVNYGLLFAASECWREDKKPNIPVPPTIVSTLRPIFPAAEPAVTDLAGAVWLSPATSRFFPEQTLQSWVYTPWGLKLRSDVPMLFIYGEKDANGKRAANSFYKNVFKADSRVGPGGQTLPKPLFTTVREVKGSANTGTKLLGNNLGTEALVRDFVEAVEKERKMKPRKTREWTKPLFIDVQSFGLMR
ncbi:MAG: hypothetical protein U0871_00715 [Gemmataceae bacterium]